MECIECEGKVCMTKEVLLPTGCRRTTPAYPCENCGRLHWLSGDGVLNRRDEPAFQVEGGRIVHRTAKGEMVIHLENGVDLPYDDPT